MANWYIRSRPPVWSTGTKALGNRCTSSSTTAGLGVHFECTTAGAAGAGEPTWDYVVGNTTTDSACVWTCRGGGAGVWQASKAYALGDRVVATTSATADRQACVRECTTAGTSGGTEPAAWTVTSGSTDTDNTVTWTCRRAQTWANAHPWVGRLHAATTTANKPAAGDDVWFAKAHAETTTGAVTVAGLGTPTSPKRFLCCDDTADPEPPTTLFDGASVAVGASAADLTWTGTHYAYGISLLGGSGANTCNMLLNAAGGAVTSGAQIWEAGLHHHRCTNSAYTLLGNIAGINEETTWINRRVKFGNVNQSIQLAHTAFRWLGGSVESGGSTLTAVLRSPSATTRTFNSSYVAGVDFSNFVSTFSFVNGAAAGGLFEFEQCKLPASWTGDVMTGTIPGPGIRAVMRNCDSADTNYRLFARDYAGTVKHETVVVRTGTLASAKHNTAEVPVSFAFATSANAKYPVIPLRDSGGQYNETTSAQTATWHVLSFTAADLDNDDLGVRLLHLGTSGTPLGSVVHSFKTDVLASAGALTADTGESWDSNATAYSAATNYVAGDIIKPTTPTGRIYRLETDAGTTAAEPTWSTTDGGTTVDATGRTWRTCRRQKFSVGFTAAEQGGIAWEITQYLASTTVYVDAIPVLS